MRRFGTVLMIVGVNLVVASIGFGIYIAALRCAIAAVETACVQGVVGMYLGLMTALPGALLWFVIFFGICLFFRGKRIRETSND